MFDLIIFPLSLDAGREQYELPGLLVTAAPRKAARMRAQDHLVLYCRLLTITGPSAGGISARPSATPWTAAQLQEIMNRLSETYFAFSGSVTAGLRAVITRLNDFLLNRNLKAVKEGQTVGILNLAVIHGDRLVVAHAGATHSFVLARNQVLHFDDGQTARGLGLSRQPVPRFYQARLEPEDLLVVSPDPPASWTAKTLAGSPPLSFDHLRRRLLNDAGVDLHAGVIRFQTGKGQVTYWRPGGRAPGEARPAHHSGSSASRTAHRDGSSQPEPAEPKASSEHKVPLAARPGIGGLPAPADSLMEAPQRTEPLPSPAALEPQVSETQIPEAQAPEASPPEVQDLDVQVPETLEAAPADIVTDAIPELGDSETSERSGVETANQAPGEASETTPATPGIFLGGSSPASEPRQPAALSPRPSRQGQVARNDAAVAQNGAAAAQASTPAAPAPDLAAQNLPKERPHRKPVEVSTVDQNAGHMQRRQRAVKRTAPRGPGAIQKGLAALGLKTRFVLRKTGAAGAKMRGSLSGALGQALPQRRDAEGRVEPFFNLSPGQMLSIALVVPLIVVTVAATVYFQTGRSQEFQIRLKRAQQYAQQASQQTDAIQQRAGWEQAYAVLLDADKFGQNEESQALKQQAINALDNLESFVRLDYQPAVRGGLPVGVKITRITATLNDVYLLDASQGRILRLFRTGSGYDIDATFSCGAGKAGTAIINPLVDMAALPPNNEMHSTVMGVDAGGNLVYCSPSQTGFDSRPLALPGSSWGTIIAMTMYNDSLYVLIPSANAVYRYDGANGVYADPPHLYFDNTIPQMDDVVDLAVDQEFLYLLHKDGRMTICESPGFTFATTKCTDPAPYGDPRPGFDPAPLTFPGARFTQIQTTQPPDPSLFALDEANKSIYHLSLRRLNLQRQYRPKIDGNYLLPNSAPTAFAIAPNRRALIAFDNQVFFALIP